MKKLVKANISSVFTKLNIVNLYSLMNTKEEQHVYCILYIPNTIFRFHKHILEGMDQCVTSILFRVGGGGDTLDKI